MELRSLYWKSALLLCFLHLVNAQTTTLPCNCDLLPNQCDVGCCCDTDCSDSDKAVFPCSNVYSFATEQSCFPATLLFRNYAPYTVSTGAGGQFCLHYDNLPSRTYYSDPTYTQFNATTVQSAAGHYGSYAFWSVTPSVNTGAYTASYKYGSQVQTLDSATNVTGHLRHPGSGSDGSCNYELPAEFLRSGSSSCSVSITNENCATAQQLSVASFVQSFSLVNDSAVLNSSIEEVVTGLVPLTQRNVTCFNASGANVTCSGTEAPALIGSECRFVLTELTLIITHEAGAGITLAEFDAVLRHYALPTRRLQTFNVTYVLGSAGVGFSRSGSPGYVAGRPVVAGQLLGSSISVAADSRQWLSLPGALPANAVCDEASATSVKFAVDAVASCRRQFEWNGTAASNCSVANDDTRQTLQLLGFNASRRVATFGNSGVADLAAWLTPLADGCGVVATDTAAGCDNAIVGAQLRVVFARTGSITMPQLSIVAASLKCTAGRVFVACSGGSCPSTQSFTTSYSVKFIDASVTSTGSTAPRSQFDLRREDDFFYLLAAENAATAAAAGRLLLLLLMLLLLLLHEL